MRPEHEERLRDAEDVVRAARWLATDEGEAALAEDRAVALMDLDSAAETYARKWGEPTDA